MMRTSNNAYRVVGLHLGRKIRLLVLPSRHEQQNILNGEGELCELCVGFGFFESSLNEGNYLLY